MENFKATEVPAFRPIGRYRGGNGLLTILIVAALWSGLYTGTAQGAEGEEPKVAEASTLNR